MAAFLMGQEDGTLTTEQCSDAMTIVRGREQYVPQSPTVLGLLLVCFGGEFDPGSGRTLAACLKHASRTGRMNSFVLLVAYG